MNEASVVQKTPSEHRMVHHVFSVTLVLQQSSELRAFTN